MTNKEIITFAIRKAEMYGFKFQWDGVIPDEGNRYEVLPLFVEYHPEVVIFNQDFAKAFWGTEMIEVYSTSLYYDDRKATYGKMARWKYHLQQMVLEKEPLNYLEQWL